MTMTTTTRQKTKRTSLRTAVASRIRRQIPIRTETGQRCPETNWAALSWAKSPGSSATVPTLLSSHHQREPLHCLIYFTLTHFMLLRLVICTHGGVHPCVQNLFHSLPRCDDHLTAWATDVKPEHPLVWRWTFLPLVSMFIYKFNGLKLVLKWRVKNSPAVFILFSWWLVEDRWRESWTGFTEPKNTAGRITWWRGGLWGAVQGIEKLHSPECFL